MNANDTMPAWKRADRALSEKAEKAMRGVIVWDSKEMGVCNNGTNITKRASSNTQKLRRAIAVAQAASKGERAPKLKWYPA